MNYTPEIIAALIASEVARFNSIVAGFVADNAIRASYGQPPQYGSDDFEHERLGHALRVASILRGEPCAE